MKDLRRILIVDDNPAIHKDIESILTSPVRDGERDDKILDSLEQELFEPETPQAVPEQIRYAIDHAYQGEEAIKMVDEMAQSGSSYSLIFMDVRMPPGIDGIRTIKKIWKNHPNIEMVICTAYSDYSWEQMRIHLGTSDKLMFIKKPFDATSCKQTALTLTTKWILQKESLRYTEKLEQEVDKRTQDLHKLMTDLKKLKEAAENHARLKSDFLARMSHEIRTPMNGILVMNDLLLTTELSEEQREYCDLAKQSAKSLLYIINNTLDYSKIEAGKMDLEEIPVDMEDLVRGVAKTTAATVREKKIDVNYRIDPEVPSELLGDPTRIRQVLMNYGTNAIKFTSEGSIVFDVTLLKDLEERSLIRFAVTDTGAGIPEEKMDKLFKPFSQGDASVNRKYGGTGLGLSICKQLAELLGGEIGVESKAGDGSTFWFEVWLRKIQLQNRKNKLAAKRTTDLSPASGPMNILVAEDNHVNRIVLERLLQNENCTLHFVTNGKDAVESFKSGQFNLILMDLQMPEMDGFEAASAIRMEEVQTGRRIPIIALTGSSHDNNREKCLQTGLDGYLLKPIHREKLIETLNKWGHIRNSE